MGAVLTIFFLRRLVEIRRLQHVHFTDFHLIPFGESTSSSATLVALTEAAEGQTVELFSVPSFQRLYSLEVSPSTLLAASAQPVTILALFLRKVFLTNPFPFFCTCRATKQFIIWNLFGKSKPPFPL